MEYKELITSKIYDYTNSLFTNDDKEPKLINKDILNIEVNGSVFGNVDSSIKNRDTAISIWNAKFWKKFFTEWFIINGFVTNR